MYYTTKQAVQPAEIIFFPPVFRDLNSTELEQIR